MITKQDSRHQFSTLRSEIVSLKNMMSAFQSEVMKELGIVKNGYSRMNDTVATTRSDVMGELQTIREEQSTGGYRQVKHSEQLENHET